MSFYNDNFDRFWHIADESLIYGVLGLDETGTPTEWSQLCWESGLKIAKRHTLEKGHDGYAAVPILLRLPSIPRHKSVYNLAATADVEVEQVTYQLFDPGEEDRTRTGAKLKTVQQSWPRLSRDAKQAIEEIVLLDDGIGDAFDLRTPKMAK